jgi:hypothetical protein
MVSWVACPFATGAVVGPEGMVGAWRLLMVLVASPFQSRRGSLGAWFCDARQVMQATIKSREFGRVPQSACHK